MTPYNNILPIVRLFFHIKVCSYHDLWLEGYEDCQQSFDSVSNPYLENSIEYDYWEDGWWAAFYDEPPLFTLEGDVIHLTDTPPDPTTNSPFLILGFFKLLSNNCLYFLR